MTNITDFNNLYPVSKTLRWSLRPIGATRHFIDENKILEEDRQKAKSYENAKALLDEVYKGFINSSLACFKDDSKFYSIGDYHDLADALDSFQKDKTANRDALYKASAICRNKIVGHMKQMDGFSAFAGSGKAREVLAHAYEIDELGELKSVFDRFSGYFNGFCQNRANLFSPEAKASSLAYRVVDVNFPKYHRNTKTLSTIKEKHTELFIMMKNAAMSFFNVEDLDLFFSTESYCDYITQTGIDRYNLVLGGKTFDDGTKLQGLNELVNLYSQKNPEVKRRDLLLVPLYKQLMEERNRESFIPRQCESDTELSEVVRTTATDVPIIHSLLSIISDYGNYDTGLVFVANKQVPSLSMDVFGSGKWNTFFELMIEMKRKEIQSYSKKEFLTKQQQKITEKITKQDFYSLRYLEEALNFGRSKNENKDDYPTLATVISSRAMGLSNTLSNCLICYDKAVTPCSVKDNPSYIEILKAYLDSLLEASKFIKAFIPLADYESDPVFYEQFNGFEELYRKIVRIYDFTRNYVTKESPAEEKFKLNFNCPTLANGWDRNKERDNLCVILRKDGNYYLAIRNKMDDSSVLINGENCKPVNGEEEYEKMIYKFLPSPSKMLPKVFFSKTGRQLPFGPSDALIAAYDAKRQGDAFYYEKGFGTERNYTTALIGYYINAIPQYGDWIEFGMTFKAPEEYESINGFYHDVEQQNYFITFEGVSKKVVDEMVASGKIFLFQIYNKDFAEGSHGKKNLHTMYWEYLFSDENLYRTHTIKLNGEAELFFRPSVSESVGVTHPKGTFLVNRNSRDGRHVPDKYHKEIYEYANGRLTSLSDGAKPWYDVAVIKKADRNLIKGKRFTDDLFFFHVPITINYNADNTIDINTETCKMLIENPDCNIIGIDRGERNLLYVSVVNQKGELLYQKSFNQVPGSNNVEVNYIEKLEDAEAAREEARKSWRTIGRIKDLKEGYLSSVISLITNLMVRYNAIVVLENLNAGFKRGRFKVERQVYQKFESALINKLGLVVSKEANDGEPRSIPVALQLAEKFESFEKIGTQTGWVFYVPAAYTSKIDPITGFANLFDLSDLTNYDKKLGFFRRFKSIKYDADELDFKFSFRYSDFKCLVKQSTNRIWLLSSRGERILHGKDGSSHKERPTEKLCEILSSAGIDYKDGSDLVSKLAGLSRNNANICLLDEFYRTFVHILQMRNSCSATGDDYIISPARSDKGYYDSRDYKIDGKYPCDADANGAYNIARKGIVMINKLRDNPKLEDFWNASKISNEEWFDYVQG